MVAQEAREVGDPGRRARRAHEVLAGPLLDDVARRRGRAPWRARRCRCPGRPRTRSRRRPRAASARPASRARRACPPAMIATRSHSCSASSIACVVSKHRHAAGRAGRARAATWSPARAGPSRRSARRGTRRRAGRSARTRATAAGPARPRAGAPACAMVVARARRRRAARSGSSRVVVVRREQAQQLERLQARIEAAFLQHHADARAQRGAVARSGRARARGRVPGVGRAVALEDLDRRRLARAVRAEQAEHLAAARRRSDRPSTATVVP